MYEISLLLQSSGTMQLDAGFICNLLAFCVVFEAVSVAIGHIANLGR